MKNYFDATALIPIVNDRRSKKVSHFLDDNRLTLNADPITTRGRGARTLLPISCLREYLLWLTPKTRKAILEGVSSREIIDNIKNYW